MPELVMPKMGDAMEEGTILQWLKSEGDQVEEGEIVAEIQTEKASIEIPALASGILTKILVKENETVPVGAPIAILDGDGGESASAGAEAGKDPGPQGGSPAPSGGQSPGDQPTGDAPKGRQTPSGDAPVPMAPDADLEHRAPNAEAVGAPGAVPAEGGRVRASGLARKIAADKGIDLSTVQGTGPGGRIIEADVTEASQRQGPGAPAAQPATTAAPQVSQPGGTERRMSPVRKVIARRLTESKQTIPHFYLTLDVDMRAAVRLRSEFNASVGEERKISFNDLVVRACALVLQRSPELNSRLEGDTIKTAGSVNIGVAVSLEEGLIVPVVRDAQTKSVSTLGQEIRQLADRARRGELKPEEYSGGGFTVSNLGMYEITQFQAIINPPEAAILAVGAIRDTPVVENGQVVPGKQMYLTISVDHRLVDGSVAAQFMQELKRMLQNPLGLLG